MLKLCRRNEVNIFISLVHTTWFYSRWWHDSPCMILPSINTKHIYMVLFWLGMECWPVLVIVFVCSCLQYTGWTLAELTWMVLRPILFCSLLRLLTQTLIDQAKSQWYGCHDELRNACYAVVGGCNGTWPYLSHTPKVVTIYVLW
mgnify:FL=1